MESLCCSPLISNTLFIPQPRYHYSIMKRVEEENLSLAKRDEGQLFKERMNGFHDDNVGNSGHHSNSGSMNGDLDTKAEGETSMDTDEKALEKDVDVVMEENKESDACELKSDERLPSPSLSEEDKIKEFMSRSDTAVIFPEPVSDQEDVEPSDQMDHDNANDDSFLLKCHHCDKVFPRLYILQDHMRTFHGNAIDRNTCPKCNEKFTNKVLLDKHMALHSITSQSCKVCHKTFANIYRLQRHMISHDESSDLRKFKCPECGKAFKFKHHLKEHVRIHSGEKPFQCSHCLKRFSHSGSYSSHMTSKKCWPWAKNIVNRRLGGKETSPQKLEQDLDHHPVSFANQYANFPRPFISQCPPLPPHFAPLLSGMQPFLPYGPFPSHLLAPMMHGLPSPIPCLPPNFGKIHPFMNDFEKTKEKMGFEKHSVQSLLGLKERDLDHEEKIKEIKDEDDGSQSDTGKEDLDDIDGNAQKSRRNSVDAHSVVNEEKKDRGLEVEDVSDARDSGNDLDSVKRILEIVERTVTKQKEHQTKDEKREISKLNGVSLSNGEGENVLSQDSGNDSEDTKLAECICSYCDEKFDSAVKLHQHERYLCTKNSSILEMKNNWLKAEPTRKGESIGSKLDLEEEEGKGQNFDLMCRFCDIVFKSAVDLHQHERYLCKNNTDIPVSKEKMADEKEERENVVNDDGQRNSSDEDDSENEEKDGGEKIKCRVRSLISEEQLRVLKSMYEINPRPRKYELIRIGNEIGFPKRVVQVWFQNMRARDRKRGKEVPYFPNMARSRRPEDMASPESLDFAQKSSPFIPMIPQHFNGAQSASSLVIPQIPPPPHAHSFNPVFMNSIRPTVTPPKIPSSSQAEPLDLSVTKRSSPSPAHCSSKSPSLNGSCGLESVLNLSIKKESPSMSLSEAEHRYILKNPTMFPSMHSPLSNTESRGFIYNKTLENGLHNSIDRNGNLCSNSKLSPFDSRIPNVNSHGSQHTTDESSCDNSVDGHPLEGSLNSSPGSFSDSVFSHSTNHSFDEFGKFSREKMMRMDHREYSPDFLDGLMDEDGPGGKKRRSWKHHKVDEGEGMYACDQCEKMFSKQSSLARHKYEHSGARPFACDICSKAFKHKHHLTEHKRLHSGEKPFMCKKCGKRFSHSGSYSQHMNHRYKYCKPTNGKMDDDTESETTDIAMMV
ncbi:zinc finger E-box-binding homeobox 1-like isoform X2 [Lineus longissimus]|uniref:zinc finger E-box-binding homeobox 1-like isoform X2 n=1 Tax=Lineus longissimus TaxID=88925 RepID=UPI002B4EA14B